MAFRTLLVAVLAAGLAEAFLQPYRKGNFSNDDAFLRAALYGGQDSSEESQESGPSDELPPTQQGCGWRNRDGLNFRKGGTSSLRSKFGEFPWTLAVFEVVANVDQYICVATLLHPRIALSVAHYFQEQRQRRVGAGEWNLNDTHENYKHQVSEVEDVVLHPKFKAKNNNYDIALLFLQSAISPHEHIGFACLPAAAAVTPPGTDCFVTGWGYKKFMDGKIQATMKMVKVPMVARDWCESRIRTVAGWGFSLHQSHLCAGGEAGKDACQRDGGAPLVCPYVKGEERYYLAGIVSWGVSCGLEDMPGVYSDVAFMKTWVDDVVRGRRFNTETYTQV